MRYLRKHGRKRYFFRCDGCHRRLDQRKYESGDRPGMCVKCRQKQQGENDRAMLEAGRL